MIFVAGLPFSTESASSHEGRDILDALLKNSVIVSATNSFKAIPERKFSVSEHIGSERSPREIMRPQQVFCLLIYVHSLSIFFSSPTTFILAKTTVAHMDSPRIVVKGFTQMLALVVDPSISAELDVHLVGGYEDVSPKQENGSTRSEGHEKLDGYSYPLCTEIIKILWTRPEKFHLHTLCVLSHNTKRDTEGIQLPIFNGFVVKTSDGSVIPASFNCTSRCPDEIVRRIRISASYEDSTWNGKLLETYETQTDRFKIAPCCWTLRQMDIALFLRRLSDSEILGTCSTSPFAEGPDFVENQRRQWAYLIEHPDWRETFLKKKPRIFQRTADGGWESCSESSGNVTMFFGSSMSKVLSD